VVSRLLLLGFLYNLSSERQLLREVQVNMAYRWYLGYDLDEAVPNHSVLSKARKRLGVKFFEELFVCVLDGCRKAGLVQGENVLLDSTLVPANASLDSITGLRYRPLEYWQQLEKSSAAESEASGDAEPGDCGVPMGQRRPRPERCNDQKYSRTDPEASLMGRPGQRAQPGYKTHFAVDDKKGIVTAVATTGGAVDDTAVVPELLEQHIEHYGPPRRVVADHLYGSQDCLAYLQGQGTETVIPPRQGGNKHGGFDKRQFAYNPREDVFQCPAGQILYRRRTWKKQGKASYAADGDTCGVCPVRSQCLGANCKTKVRQVTRFDTPYVDNAQASCAGRSGRRLLQKRQTCIEGLFGQAKNYHGLGRARWRGADKMHVQSLLTALVLNVKKLLKALSGTTLVLEEKAATPERFGLLQNVLSLCYEFFKNVAQGNFGRIPAAKC